MTYYKGFNNDMTCRGFQYEEGREYHEKSAEICKKGFHACEYPLDCLGYYAPSESVYRKVELGEDAHGDGADTKKCSTTIKIGAKLDVAGIVEAAVEYTREHCTNNAAGGDQSALTGGDQSALTGGYRSALTGGDRSALTGGHQSALTGGDRSALTGGDRSALTGGYWSVLRGGEGCKFKGGMWSVFAAEIWNNGKLADMKTAVVDGKNIKPDTWYQFDGKEFAEIVAKKQEEGR